MAKGPGEEPRVFVIDDDASVRQALTSLLQSAALNVGGVWFACRLL